VPDLRRRPAVRLLAACAVLLAGAGAVPAAAHAPRDHRQGAPKIDLEVLVPPPVTGETSGGARDAHVVVDRFGNRLAVARPSLPAGTVDSRSRYQARNGLWLWGSYDEGMSWEALELLPRALDALAPHVDDYAIGTDGTKTFVAWGAPTGALVTPLVASRRGRVEAGVPMPVVASRLPGVFELGVRGATPMLLVSNPTGVQLVDVVSSVVLATLPPAESCDLAVGRKKVVAVVVCLDAGSIRRSTVTSDGRVTTTVLGRADVRGGDAGSPSIDVGPDGSVGVLSGTRLWWTDAKGRTRAHDLHNEPGAYRSTSLAVTSRNRVVVGGYRRHEGVWDVVVTLFTPGTAPVWVDFAYHDPVAPLGAASPPSSRVSVDSDPQGRLQLLWTVSQVHQAELDRPLLHNVWAVRSLST